MKKVLKFRGLGISHTYSDVSHKVSIMWRKGEIFVVTYIET